MLVLRAGRVWGKKSRGRWGRRGGGMVVRDDALAFGGRKGREGGGESWWGEGSLERGLKLWEVFSFSVSFWGEFEKQLSDVGGKGVVSGREMGEKG